VTATFKLGVAVSYLMRISGIERRNIESAYDAGINDGVQLARRIADQGLDELKSYTKSKKETTT
jgi:hypothetical protein